MKERLFLSLREQLKYEIFFVTNVSRPYYSPSNDHKIVDFKYKSCEYQLVLNGSIYLKTNRKKMDANRDNREIKSYNDLIEGLINSVKKRI